MIQASLWGQVSFTEVSLAYNKHSPILSIQLEEFYTVCNCVNTTTRKVLNVLTFLLNSSWPVVVCVCVCARVHACVRTCVLTLSHFSHVWLFVTLWTMAHQAPLCMGFSRQEFWSELPCTSPEDLPNPGIQPPSLCLLLWQEGSLPLTPPGKAYSQSLSILMTSPVYLFFLCISCFLCPI